MEENLTNRSTLSRSALRRRILAVTEDDFDQLALDIYAYQYTNNPIYRAFCDLLGKPALSAGRVDEIPCLPISLFKQELITTNAVKPKIVFESSGTSGSTPARHAVYDPLLYQAVSRRGFMHCYGRPVEAYQWLALLPSYLERSSASLVYMVRQFMAHQDEHFYLKRFDELVRTLESPSGDRPRILIGVTFALLELAEYCSIPLHNTTVIETGGMKGRGAELPRERMHHILSEAFGIQTVHSEYGMTELLSQAWSVGGGVFRPGPTLRVLMRDLTDPQNMLQHGVRGALNCIDLANLDSCAFLATDDIGVRHADGTFEVHGRLEGSEIRGCNLMVQDI